MSKTVTETMTLAEFISRMKDGWGFRKPWTVKHIGDALDGAFATSGREAVVTVKFTSGNYGYGPSFHYTYDWEVEGEGVKPAQSGTLPPSERDVVFGFLKEQLPTCTLTDRGFRVGYLF